MTDKLEDYDRIEQEVGQWAEENFGTEQPEWYPLVGAAEELGELAACYRVHAPGRMTGVLLLMEAVGTLAHSVLKQAQGIREDESGVDRRGEVSAISEIHKALGVIEMVDGVGRATLQDMDNAVVADAVGDTHVYLADYVARSNFGYTLGESVELAWYDEVSDREWDADVEVEDGQR